MIEATTSSRACRGPGAFTPSRHNRRDFKVRSPSPGSRAPCRRGWVFVAARRALADRRVRPIIGTALEGIPVHAPPIVDLRVTVEVGPPGFSRVCRLRESPGMSRSAIRALELLALSRHVGFWVRPWAAPGKPNGLPCRPLVKFAVQWKGLLSQRWDFRPGNGGGPG